MIYLQDSFMGEGKSSLCTGQHTANRLVRICLEERILRFEIKIELNRYLVNVITLAFMPFPYMLQIGIRYQYKIKIFYNLTRITHDATAACCPCHEVQFKDIMLMNKMVELLLMVIGNTHKIMLAHR